MERIPHYVKRHSEYNIGWNDGRCNLSPKYLLVSKLFHLEYFMGYDEGRREKEECDKMSTNKWLRRFPSSYVFI